MNDFNQCRVISIDPSNPMAIDLPKIFSAGWNYDVQKEDGTHLRDGNRAVDALVARLSGYGKCVAVDLSTEGAVISFVPHAGIDLLLPVSQMIKNQYAIEAERFVETGRCNMPNLGEVEIVGADGSRTFTLRYYDRYQQKTIALWSGDLAEYQKMCPQLAYLSGAQELSFSPQKVEELNGEPSEVWLCCLDSAMNFGALPVEFEIGDSTIRNYDEMLSMLTPDQRKSLAQVIATHEQDSVN